MARDKETKGGTLTLLEKGCAHTSGSETALKTFLYNSKMMFSSLQAHHLNLLPDLLHSCLIDIRPTARFTASPQTCASQSVFSTLEL